MYPDTHPAFCTRPTHQATSHRGVLDDDLEVIGVSSQVVDPSASETGGLPNIIMSMAIELTNDGGSWLGEGRGFGSSDLEFVKEIYTLVGQGGSEGLTAYVIAETTGREPALSGIIFPSGMPEAPEPYAGE